MAEEKQDKYNYPPGYEKLPLHEQRCIELMRKDGVISREGIEKWIATPLGKRNIFESEPGWMASIA